MKLRRGAQQEDEKDDGPADPYAELFRLSKAAQKKEEEGNVTNSLAMLTAIPEVDLGMECVPWFVSGAVSLADFVCSTRLKNIEDTEKAKRQMSELRKERSKRGDDEAHLAAARCMCLWLLLQALKGGTHRATTICSLPTESQGEVRRRYHARC